MVSENEVSAFGNLIGKLNVAVTESFFKNIRLIDQNIVNVNISFIIYIDPLTGTCDVTLDEELVSNIEADEVTDFKIHSLDRNNDIAFTESRCH